LGSRDLHYIFQFVHLSQVSVRWSGGKERLLVLASYFMYCCRPMIGNCEKRYMHKHNN
jgi:hypothetical protein